MKRNDLPPAKLDYAGMIGWLDTRELPIDQHPWTQYLPFTLERHTLPFGDFTIPGLDKRLIFERKSLQDFIGCCGKERERFSKVITAMRGYDWPFVVIEGSWEDLEKANWRGEITSSQAIGTLHGYQADGIHVILAGDAPRAAKIVARVSFTIVRRLYESAREIIGSCFAQEGPA
jgi:ERCC4-type nuclease